jgi:hypothetical protein
MQRGDAAPVPERRRPFREYVEWLGTRQSSAADAFWRERLAGFKRPKFVVFTGDNVYYDSEHPSAFSPSCSRMSTDMRENRNGRRIYALADYTVEQLYDFLKEHQLRRAPGEQYEYSNVGYGLLGHILTLVSKPAPATPQFRLIYRTVDAQTLTIAFEMAPAGQAGAFKPYLSGRLRRAATFLRQVGVEIDFNREGSSRIRTIHIAIAAENSGTQPSAPSASSAPVAKPRPTNGFAPPGLRTVFNVADGMGIGQSATVRAKALNRNGEDGADDTDANDPLQSAPEKAGWRARL